jgi:hypothetical protein
MTGSRREYFVGLDLGQVQDYSAIAVMERAEVCLGVRDLVSYEYLWETTYLLRYLERLPLGTTYPDVVARVDEVMRGLGTCTLVVDATGVGGPVVDLLRAAGMGDRLVAVTITGSDDVTRGANGTWRVPKRGLLTGLQVMLQSGELGIAAGLVGADDLVREMRGMRVKLSAGGMETFGAWRSGAHDDLVLATALACWRAMSLIVRRGPLRSFDLAHLMLTNNRFPAVPYFVV